MRTHTNECQRANSAGLIVPPPSSSIVESMNISKKTTSIAVAGAAALALGITAVASAGGEDAAENERPIPAAQYDRATAAALKAVPGKVTDTEADDQEGAFEVEVTRADGKEVDVHLDERFNVVGEEAETAEPGDKD